MGKLPETLTLKVGFDHVPPPESFQTERIPWGVLRYQHLDEQWEIKREVVCRAFRPRSLVQLDEPWDCRHCSLGGEVGGWQDEVAGVVAIPLSSQ